MPAQLYSAPIAAGKGAASAYASSNTLADVSPNPQVTLEPNFLVPGSILRLTAKGVFSNTSTPTLILGFYYGGVAGTALCASGAVTTITSASNWQWQLEATMIVRTDGSTGTAHCAGRLYMPASLTAFQAAYPIPAANPQNTVTIDTTTAKLITVGAQWSASSGSNTLTCHQFLVESVA